MWSSFVGLWALCLSASFLGLESGAESSNQMYTTTNVLRQRPFMANSLEHKRHLSKTPFFQNTYNPFSSKRKSDIESLSKTIPWGAINIVVVTDVHSWIAGNHRDDPRHWPYDVHRSTNQDADYGNILSFYQRLQQLVDHHNHHHSDSKRDILFVMNGDFVDGTGFSGYPPVHLAPLLQHMPWDAINVGNHELYHDETIQYIMDQQQKKTDSASTVRWNPQGYLSSNTVQKTTNSTTKPPPPMTGHRYTYLEGQYTNTTILAFGFLYDFDEGGSLTEHVDVQDVVQAEWFQRVLGENAPRDFDAILVLAHMDCLHPLIEVLLEGIRDALPPNKRESMPIQFVTGHTHRRCHSKLDQSAESFEAGRFLDTIGFVSLDVVDHDTTRFSHRFLDANQESLHEVLVMEYRNHDITESFIYDFDVDFGTPEGRALTKAIRTTQSQLGLDEVLGCAPQTYGIFEDPFETATNDEPSLWDLYLHQMLPRQLLEPFDGSSGEPVFVSGTGILRYSIFEGPVTVNDIIAISPFNDTIHELVTVDEDSQSLPIFGWQLLDFVEAANELYAKAGEYGLPTFVLSTIDSASSPIPITGASQTIHPTKVYRIFATDYDAYRLLSVVKDAAPFFQSQLLPPNDHNSDCIYLTELWKAFVREQMPCPSHSSLRSHHHDFDASLLSSAQILQPPSAAAASVHSRMTPAQEDKVLASDQKAAALLVIVALALIVYLLVHPPEPQTTPSGRNTCKVPQPNFTASMQDDSRHCRDHESNDASLQLIPLRRYNTGNLSEGSYGSI